MVTDNRCKAKKDQLHSDMNNLFRIIHYKLGLITEFDGKIRQFFSHQTFCMSIIWRLILHDQI